MRLNRTEDLIKKPRTSSSVENSAQKNLNRSHGEY